jgi:hypothetical protein
VCKVGPVGLKKQVEYEKEWRRTANVGLVLGEIDESWDCISGSSMVPGTMLKL